MNETSAGKPLSGRALLLEDNAVVALDTEDMLRSMGFDDVDVAPSIARALECLAANKYSAGVFDLMVKDGSSAPIAERFRQMRVPYVIASGYETRDLGEAVAAAPSVPKPYDETMLREALREAAHRTR